MQWYTGRKIRQILAESDACVGCYIQNALSFYLLLKWKACTSRNKKKNKNKQEAADDFAYMSKICPPFIALPKSNFMYKYWIKASKLPLQCLACTYICSISLSCIMVRVGMYVADHESLLIQ